MIWCRRAHSGHAGPIYYARPANKVSSAPGSVEVLVLQIRKWVVRVDLKRSSEFVGSGIDGCGARV